jgi:hypothetical protein
MYPSSSAFLYSTTDFHLKQKCTSPSINWMLAPNFAHSNQDYFWLKLQVYSVWKNRQLASVLCCPQSLQRSSLRHLCHLLAPSLLPRRLHRRAVSAATPDVSNFGTNGKKIPWEEFRFANSENKLRDHPDEPMGLCWRINQEYVHG